MTGSGFRTYLCGGEVGDGEEGCGDGVLPAAPHGGGGSGDGAQTADSGVDRVPAGGGGQRGAGEEHDGAGRHFSGCSVRR